MEEQSSPNPLLRRKSIAGPFMRSSGGIPAEHRPAGSSATASSSSTTDTQSTPPPLTRANTHSGGWFSSWFGGRSSISSSSGVPRSQVEPQVEDNYAHLASSAPQVLPAKADSRETLNNSRHASGAAAGQTPASGNTPPPLARRLSEVALQRPNQLNNNSKHTGSTTTIAASATTTTTKATLMETDIRQGPIETDLFWLVLRDIGE